VNGVSNDDTPQKNLPLYKRDAPSSIPAGTNEILFRANLSKTFASLSISLRNILMTLLEKDLPFFPLSDTMTRSSSPVVSPLS
jgi:hypothetical protein